MANHWAAPATGPRRRRRADRVRRPLAPRPARPGHRPSRARRPGDVAARAPRRRPINAFVARTVADAHPDADQIRETERDTHAAYERAERSRTHLDEAMYAELRPYGQAAHTRDAHGRLTAVVDQLAGVQRDLRTATAQVDALQREPAVRALPRTGVDGERDRWAADRAARAGGRLSRGQAAPAAPARDTPDRANPTRPKHSRPRAGHRPLTSLPRQTTANDVRSSPQAVAFKDMDNTHSVATSRPACDRSGRCRTPRRLTSAVHARPTVAPVVPTPPTRRSHERRTTPTTTPRRRRAAQRSEARTGSSSRGIRPGQLHRPSHRATPRASASDRRQDAEAQRTVLSRAGCNGTGSHHAGTSDFGSGDAPRAADLRKRLRPSQRPPSARPGRAHLRTGANWCAP